MLYGDRISKIICFDIREITRKESENYPGNISVARTWQEVYDDSDIVITCTVSDKTYIDRKPKSDSLLLNISLRDYKPEVFEFVRDSIIVDDWDEVCRENTDIENFHKQKFLEKEQVKTIVDVAVGNCLKTYPSNIPIMFNLMGMGIFDIAIAKYYFDSARERNLGIELG